MSITAVNLRPGDEVVSDFSGRVGRIEIVYLNDVQVRFEGYDEPVRIGFDAAVAYRRAAVGNRV